MILEIREATQGDAKQIGFVHCTAWLETYTGLINPVFLASLSPERSTQRFEELGCRDMLVLSADGSVVGFSAYGQTRDADLPETCGDVRAIYILKAYQRLGYGRKLLESSLEKLRQEGFETFSIWVLKENKNAIAFYEKCGFVFDGTEKEVLYTTPVTCRRYMLNE
jgi:ribosomal protein S18 acetylase RimI-like enzyme